MLRALRRLLPAQLTAQSKSQAQRRIRGAGQQDSREAGQLSAESAGSLGICAEWKSMKKHGGNLVKRGSIGGCWLHVQRTPTRLVGNVARRAASVCGLLPRLSWATSSLGLIWVLGLTELPSLTAGQHTKLGALRQRTFWPSPETIWIGPAVQAVLVLSWLQQHRSEADLDGPHPSSKPTYPALAIRTMLQVELRCREPHMSRIIPSQHTLLSD